MNIVMGIAICYTLVHLRVIFIFMGLKHSIITLVRTDLGEWVVFKKGY